MKKIITIATMLAMTTGFAYASVGAPTMSYSPVYETITHYDTETKTVCTKTDDKTTEGGIAGALIGGATTGDAEGAIFGGIIGVILGDAAGGETCESVTENTPTHTEQVFIGYDIVVTVGDQTYVINHRV